MSGKDNGAAASPEATPAAPAAAARPQMAPGMTYFMVPAPVFTEVVKVLRKMPYEDVESALGGLQQCQPVQGDPAVAE